MRRVWIFFKTLFKKDVSGKTVLRCWKKFKESSEEDLIPGKKYKVRDELPILYYNRHLSGQPNFRITLDIRKGRFLYYMDKDLVAMSSPKSNMDICSILMSKSLSYFSTTVDALIEAIEEGMNEL